MPGNAKLASIRNGHGSGKGDASEDADLRSGAPLSVREGEVLRLLAEGKNNVEIALELFISRQTVKKHVSSILAKVQVDNRVQAAVYAVRKGIV